MSISYGGLTLGALIEEFVLEASSPKKFFYSISIKRRN